MFIIVNNILPIIFKHMSNDIWNVLQIPKQDRICTLFKKDISILYSQSSLYLSTICQAALFDQLF